MGVIGHLITFRISVSIAGVKWIIFFLSIFWNKNYILTGSLTEIWQYYKGGGGTERV